MAVTIAPPSAPLPAVGPSPQSLKKRQDLMDAMLANATKVRPIGSILEGLAQVGTAGLAGWWGGEADRDADKQRQEASSRFAPLLAAMMGGGGAGGALAPSAAPAAGGWQQPTASDNLMSMAPAGSYGGEDLPEWQRTLMMRESSGRPGIVNSGGYSGLYQFGEGAAHDAGFYSGDDDLTDNQWGGTFTGPGGEALSHDQWLQSPEAQNQGFAQYTQGLERQFRDLGLDRYIGQTVNGVQVTLPGLIMGAHLGGVGGLKRWLTGGGNAADSNGTKVGDYVAMGAQFPDAAMAQAAGKEKGPQYRDSAGKPDLTTMMGLDQGMQWSAPSGAAPGSDINPLPALSAPGLPLQAQPNPTAQYAQLADYGGTMGFAPRLPVGQPSPIPEMASRALGADNTWAFQRDPQMAPTNDATTAAAQPYAQPSMPVSGAPPSIMAQPLGAPPIQAQQQSPQMAPVSPSPNAMPDTFAMMAQQGMQQPATPPPSPAPAAAPEALGPSAAGNTYQLGAPDPALLKDRASAAAGGLTPGYAPPPGYAGIGKSGGAPGAPQAPQGRDALLAQLVTAMSDPWLDDGSKQIAGTLLAQAMKPPDAADWQKFDDNTLFNPADGQMRDIGPEAFKPAETRTVDRGGEQVTEQWDAQAGQWTEIGRSPRWNPNGGTTINNMGNIPAGYEVFTDPASGATRMRPIPGGPADMEQQAAAAKTQGASADAAAQGGLVIQDIQKALDLVEGNQGFTVGPLATIGRINSAGAGQQLVDLLDTVKANVGFSQIQQMRENSPTGGALGQVTERELAFLQASLGALNPNGSPELLRRNLQRLMNLYMDQVHGTPEEIRRIGPTLGLSPEEIEQLAARYPGDGAPGATPGASAPASKYVPGYEETDEDTGIRHRFLGGDPTKEENWEAVQ